MSEKRIYGRAVQKHDLEKNWIKATNFIPMAGEIIIYDRDDNVADESLKGTYSYERIKIGDGVQNVNALPSVGDDLKAELVEQIGVVDDKVDKVIALVGDEKVSDQIAAAQIVHVGPNMPTDPNIKLWIKTDEDGGTGAVSVIPTVSTVTLNADAWTGNKNPWSQVVTINGVTANSKIDPQPTAVQIVELQDAEITFMLQNDNGVVTAWAIGNKPTKDFTMDVLITEVIRL